MLSTSLLKARVVFKTLLLTITFATSSLYAEDKPNKEIIIAGDNWCPVNCSEMAKNQGYMIDVAKAALKKSGYTVKYIEMPWTRAVGLARKGEIHAIVGAFTGDAPDFQFPKTALLNISANNLFVKTSNDWQYSGLSSLNQITLGVIKGYDYGETLNNYVNSLVTTDSSNINQLYGDDAVKRNIELLLRDRIEVFVESGPVFWFQAKSMNVVEQVKEIGSISEPEPCFIAFSPALNNSIELTTALEHGITELKKNNKLSEIAAIYGLPKSAYDFD